MILDLMWCPKAPMVTRLAAVLLQHEFLSLIIHIYHNPTPDIYFFAQIAGCLRVSLFCPPGKEKNPHQFKDFMYNKTVQDPLLFLFWSRKFELNLGEAFCAAVTMRNSADDMFKITSTSNI